jgi:hypothetical protein
MKQTAELKIAQIYQTVELKKNADREAHNPALSVGGFVVKVKLSRLSRFISSTKPTMQKRK